MTVTAPPTAAAIPTASDLLTVTIDGVDLQVPKGTLVIRAAELVGVAVPRFCDHPLLDPVAACRMCLVEIEGQSKPQPACAITVAEGMKVKTQLTSDLAHQAQLGVMEFLLINHPLDCPICDKGGECPLQNQALANGRGESRFDGVKRTFPKPINVSAQVLLDRERCVSCARCTRFAEQIAGDPFIELLERGSQQQVGISLDTPFNSYFSGNTVQICPVGALTSAKYRFRSRPFDLVSTPTVCEHCAGGCSLRTDVRRSTVMRRLAWDEPEVNEEWNCDKGRFAFPYLSEGRLTGPLIRDEDGNLVAASWPEALDAAARGLAAAGSATGVLTGGRLTLQDAYAYAKFARIALGTDDIDFRARRTSAEEAAFLAALVAGRPLGPTYTDLEHAPVVVLVALEAEDEAAMVFLRLRKGARKHGLRVFSVAPFETSGVHKTSGTLLATMPGDEPQVLESLMATPEGDSDIAAAAALLRLPGAVVLVGERLGQVPGGLSAAARLADATGARLAWVPRRAGERGALDAGALSGLLPGGRPGSDTTARAEVAAVWGVSPDSLPTTPGRELGSLVAAVLADHVAIAGSKDPAKVERSVQALLVAGVQIADLPDPVAFQEALRSVPFLVALEQRPSAVTELADVVFPVAVVTEKAGTFVNWEGRIRPFAAVLPDATTLPDGRVLAMIADYMDVKFGRGDVATLTEELAALGAWSGERPAAPSVAAVGAASPLPGELILATWRALLDGGVLEAGEPFLAATARPEVVRLSPATAARLRVTAGESLTVSAVLTNDASEGGEISLPLEVTPTLLDDVVWVPGKTAVGSLGIPAGAAVRVARGGGA